MRKSLAMRELGKEFKFAAHVYLTASLNESQKMEVIDRLEDKFACGLPNPAVIQILHSSKPLALDKLRISLHETASYMKYGQPLSTHQAVAAFCEEVAQEMQISFDKDASDNLTFSAVSP